MRRVGRRCGRVDALGCVRPGSAWPAADGRNASAQVSARLQHRPAPRGLVVPGLALASVALLTGVEADGSYATHRLPGILLIGFSFGLAFMLLFATATGGISPQDSGGTSASSRPRPVRSDHFRRPRLSLMMSV